MTNVELAWAAGVVDGEGCIAVYFRSTGRGKPKSWRVHLAIANTDIRMPQEIARLFGGKVYRTGHRTTVRREMWQWSAGGPNALGILELILPYLVIKREQAELALEYHPVKKGKRLTSEEDLNRRSIDARLRLLKRGA